MNKKIIVCRFKKMKSSKSMFMEYFQERGLRSPKIVVNKIGGPSHKPTFRATIKTSSFEWSEEGLSKKAAMHAICDKYLSSIPKPHPNQPLFTVQDWTVRINTDVAEQDERIAIASLDVEADVNLPLLNSFVCAQVALPTTKEIHIFTNVNFFLAFASLVDRFVVFRACQMESRLFPHLEFVELMRLIDMNVLGKEVGLRHLVEYYLHARLSKDLQTSFRVKTDLTPAQINYAACDALATWQIYVKING